MDQVIFLPTIGVGTILIVIYMLLCRRVGNKAELPTIINMVFYASGVVGGSVLLISCFSQHVLQKLSDIKIYIFIAGIAVLYVSVQGVRTAMLFPERNHVGNAKESSHAAERKPEESTV